MQHNMSVKAAAVYSKSDKRDYSLDNIRFLLIFSVVFAHLLEVCNPFWGSTILYKIIYSFHMPVFIFMFGYNVRYSPARIVCRWCIPYLVFQSVYILFAKVVLRAGVNFQYTTPYWLLWYMLVCIFYQLLLPLYHTPSKRKQVYFVTGAFLFSFFIGFWDSVGYGMSLSRFFVFQPWFLLGLYCKKNGFLETISVHSKRRFIVMVSAAVILLSVLLLCGMHIPNGLLYGAVSYQKSGGALWMRVAISLVSLAWIVFLFAAVKQYVNKKVTIVTNIGQNTWPVFLLHGFIVKAVSACWPELLSAPLYVLLLTCAVLVITGNKIFNNVVYYMSFSWLEKLIKDK